MGVINYSAHLDAISNLFDAKAIVYSAKNSEAFEGASPNIDSVRPDFSTPQYIDVPCYVEFENRDIVVGNIPTTTQRITLICAESWDIQEGATIEVTKHGGKRYFRAAGIADRLGSHQEIPLESIQYAGV